MTSQENKRDQLEVVAYNVDGLDEKKWQQIKIRFLTKSEKCASGGGVDVLFLSETKKKQEDLLKMFSEVSASYEFIINAHNPARWHGVVMLYSKSLLYKYKIESLQDVVKEKMKACPVRHDCNDPKASASIGRIIAIKLSPIQTSNSLQTNSSLSISIVGTYVPNSGRMEAQKLDYRINKWDPALFSLLNHLAQERSEGAVVWCGDINVAPQEIDVTHPKTMKNYAGFTPQERANFQKFMVTPPGATPPTTTSDAKKNAFDVLAKSSLLPSSTEKSLWVDAWRHLNAKKCGYSWHSDKIPEKPKVRSEMRLDNIIVTQNLLHKIKTAQIHNDFLLSDHSPISLSFSLL